MNSDKINLLLQYKFNPSAENLEILFNQYSAIDLLKHLSEKLLTQEICNLAYNKSYYSFEYIPEKFQTEDMCISAVKHSSEFFTHVKKQNLKICLEAVKAHYGAIAYIRTQEHLTFEVFIEAYKKNRYFTIPFLHKDLISPLLDWSITNQKSIPNFEIIFENMSVDDKKKASFYLNMLRGNN